MDGFASVSTEYHDGTTETSEGHVALQLKQHLSTTQLILRRGLVMFVAVALLAVGVTVHFLVPFPDTLPTDTNSTIDWSNNTYDLIFSTAAVPL